MANPSINAGASHPAAEHDVRCMAVAAVTCPSVGAAQACRSPTRGGASVAICKWCERPYKRLSRGGSAQLHCSKTCRAKFHRAVRCWAIAEFEAGRLTLARLRSYSH